MKYIDSKESISPWNQEIKLIMSFTIYRKREGNKIKFLHRRSLQTYTHTHTHTHTHNSDDKARKTHTHTEVDTKVATFIQVHTAYCCTRKNS